MFLKELKSCKLNPESVLAFQFLSQMFILDGFKKENHPLVDGWFLKMGMKLL
jgi:hypothetical protein